MEHLDGATTPLGHNAASPLHPDFTRLPELGTSELRSDSVHEQPPQDRGDVLLHHDPHTAFMHMRTCHQNGDRPLMDSPTSASDVVRDGTEDVKDRMKHEDPEAAPASIAEVNSEYKHMPIAAKTVCAEVKEPFISRFSLIRSYGPSRVAGKARRVRLSFICRAICQPCQRPWSFLPI